MKASHFLATEQNKKITDGNNQIIKQNAEESQQAAKSNRKKALSELSVDEFMQFGFDDALDSDSEFEVSYVLTML